MERLAVNLNLGQVRRETINGREYLVAPATLINPGVLPGSQGPLYYPPSQCARNVAAWNKVPLVLYHPSDPLTNAPIPANSDGVLDRQGLGFMRRTAFNGKLQTETCFDVERTRAADARHGTDVLQMLKRNQRIELSTGLYTDNVPAPQGYRDHNGNLYSGLVATNYRPDHVAILPDQVGACSVDNGCGVLVNQDPVRVVKPVEGSRKEATVSKRVTNTQGRDPAGRFGDDAEEEAAERGESTEELTQDDREGPDDDNSGNEAEAVDGNGADERGGDAGKGGKKLPTRNTPSMQVRNAREKSCPECGESLDEDGECECGYVANAWTEEARAAAAEARKASAKAGTSSRELTTGPHARYGRAAAAASKDAGFHVGGGDHAQAAQFHGEAAAHHDTAGERLQAMGHTDAAEQHFAAAGEHLRAATAHATASKAISPKDRPTGNADVTQPRHQESGEYLHTGGKPGTKQTQKAATKGFGDLGTPSAVARDVPYDTDDDYEDSLVEPDPEDGRGKATLVRVPDKASAGKVRNANPEGVNQYTAGGGGSGEHHPAAVEAVKKITSQPHSAGLRPDQMEQRGRDQYFNQPSLAKAFKSHKEAGKAVRAAYEAGAHIATNSACRCGGKCATCQAHLAYNRRWPQPQRDRLAPKDFAGPGQSFPISTQADVDAAAKLAGKTANPDAVKKRITAIATRKNLTLPDSWKKEEIMTNSNPEGVNQYTGSGGRFAVHVGSGGPDAKVISHHDDFNQAKGAAKEHNRTTGKRAVVRSTGTGKYPKGTPHFTAESHGQHSASGTFDTSGVEPKFTATDATGKPRPTRNSEVRPMTRKQKVALLTANCTCEQDRQTINTLSDETLSVLVTNAKAEGSNADASAAEGEVQAGGEEDDDDKNDEEWEDETVKQVRKKQPADNADTDENAEQSSTAKPFKGAAAPFKARNKMSTNELNALSVELFGRPVADVRSVVANALEHERREKLTLARRLVANVADPARRKLLGNKLMKLTKEDLEERVSMIGPVANEQQRGTPPGVFYGAAGMDPGGLYLGAAGAFEPPTANQTADDGPPLDIPTINYAELASPNIRANK